ncbi:hypothetical protein [Burkholderia sp. WSM2232]|uniref:hypothetical protein n=1 Tax=Burkholderia sp. WSM2232 TaxID=944436 RepID=UPI000408D9F2|nr:hypothetical protein [Burkholderia sp. WSM2232]
MENVLPPAGVGPHEFAEYEMMAARTKNLAMFSDLIPAAFIHDPSNLHLGMIASDDLTCTIYYRQGYRETAERLLALNLSTRGKGFIPEVEREIGLLLGYDDWEIDAFLKHVGRLPDQTSR